MIFPYKVRVDADAISDNIDDDDPDPSEDLEDFLSDDFKWDFEVDEPRRQFIFYFEDVDVAILFKLRFG